MTKYQRFAINHFLSYYPDEWDYPEILEGVAIEDHDNITVWHAHENEPTEHVVHYIEQMVKSLEDTFSA